MKLLMRIVFIALAILGTVLLSIGKSRDIDVMFWLGLIIVVADCIVILIFNRCPHCKRYLGKSYGGYCPHCGKKL